jgi:hypothetical protein
LIGPRNSFSVEILSVSFCAYNNLAISRGPIKTPPGIGRTIDTDTPGTSLSATI